MNLYICLLIFLIILFIVFVYMKTMDTKVKDDFKTNMGVLKNDDILGTYTGIFKPSNIVVNENYLKKYDLNQDYNKSSSTGTEFNFYTMDEKTGGQKKKYENIKDYKPLIFNNNSIKMLNNTKLLNENSIMESQYEDTTHSMTNHNNY